MAMQAKIPTRRGVRVPPSSSVLHPPAFRQSSQSPRQIIPAPCILELVRGIFGISASSASRRHAVTPPSPPFAQPRQWLLHHETASRAGRLPATSQSIRTMNQTSKTPSLRRATFQPSHRLPLSSPPYALPRPSSVGASQPTSSPRSS